MYFHNFEQGQDELSVTSSAFDLYPEMDDVKLEECQIDAVVPEVDSNTKPEAFLNHWENLFMEVPAETRVTLPAAETNPTFQKNAGTPAVGLPPQSSFEIASSSSTLSDGEFPFNEADESDDMPEGFLDLSEMDTRSGNSFIKEARRKAKKARGRCFQELKESRPIREKEIMKKNGRMTREQASKRLSNRDSASARREGDNAYINLLSDFLSQLETSLSQETRPSASRRRAFEDEVQKLIGF